MEILNKNKNERNFISLLKKIIKKLLSKFKILNFFNSKDYWEDRYKKGYNSGDGSYGKLAEFKADVINTFVKVNNVKKVIEFGCGDGNQLKYFLFNEYTGFDVSLTIIESCRKLYENDKHKKFRTMNEYKDEQAELVLSLDVLYHLVERNVYEEYISKLFNAASKYVIIYSSNTNNNSKNQTVHVKHRKFSDYVELNFPNWKLLSTIPNRYPFMGDYKEGSIADFFIYKKII